MCTRKMVPYGGKWHNEATDGTITVITYNAAQLDEMSRLGNDEELLKYKKDSHLDQLEISGMKTDVFVDDNFYVDSEKTIKNIYLFNEEYGYGVRVWSESNLPAEELIKVAEGMEIRVLDETVPYTTDEEIKVIKKEQERLERSGDRQRCLYSVTGRAWSRRGSAESIL